MATKNNKKMVTQALVSSSSLTSSVEATRQILGSRPTQSSTRRSTSFVVRAAATSPVKEQTDPCGLLPNRVFLTWMADQEEDKNRDGLSGMSGPGASGRSFDGGYGEGRDRSVTSPPRKNEKKT